MFTAIMCYWSVQVWVKYAVGDLEGGASGDAIPLPPSVLHDHSSMFQILCAPFTCELPPLPPELSTIQQMLDP